MATKTKLLQVKLNDEIREFVEKYSDKEMMSMSRFIVSCIEEKKKRVERSKG